MTLEKARLGEQALNRIAEVALASQLGKVERLKVQIKTEPSKLARGEVSFITINVHGLVIQQDLRVEELQLKINSVTVKPLGALLGKIKLTQPSEGTARIVINEDNLNSAFNSKSFHKNLPQIQGFVEDKRVTIHIQQVKCRLLADGNIAFISKLILGNNEVQALAFIATPLIETDGQEIVFQDLHYLEGKEISPELTAALVAQLSAVLSMRNFEQKGISLRIQQIDVASGKLTLHATAYIKQFSSS